METQTLSRLRAEIASHKILGICQNAEINSRLFPHKCSCGMAYSEDWQLQVHLFRMGHGLVWPFAPEILNKQHKAA